MEVKMSMELNLTPRALSILALAKQFAEERGCPTIGSEHIALAAAAGSDSLAGKALRAFGVTVAKLDEQVMELTGGQ